MYQCDMNKYCTKYTMFIEMHLMRITLYVLFSMFTFIMHGVNMECMWSKYYYGANMITTYVQTKFKRNFCAAVLNI